MGRYLSTEFYQVFISKYNVVFKPINVAIFYIVLITIIIHNMILLPTKLQVVSPILQISVISYFYRGD